MEALIITRFIGKNYAFLSNFATVGITVDEIQYPSVEHAFQASKTDKHDERVWILRAATPGIAKYRGRRVTLREDWETVKVDVMHRLLQQKFGPTNPEFRRRLLATGTAALVEGNTWHDLYWGVCECLQHHGRGDNQLGRLLMRVRTEIAKS